MLPLIVAQRDKCQSCACVGAWSKSFELRSNIFGNRTYLLMDMLSTNRVATWRSFSASLEIAPAAHPHALRPATGASPRAFLHNDDTVQLEGFSIELPYTALWVLQRFGASGLQALLLTGHSR
jgi:hypothetical protein